MNARDNTPLRTLIADHLAAGEDTAAGIAQAIGKGDTPSIVVKELNAMRTDGQVECEQRERGKKKVLVYWLAVPSEGVMMSAKQKTYTCEEVLAMRKKANLNQSEFWSPIGVTQSGGSRYESGCNIPRPVQMLLRIAYGTKAQAAKQVEALRPGADQEAAS